MADPAAPPRLLPLSVALISVAALGYEVLLIRLLSIMHWHHFAWMVISLALLGYGASGTVLALARRWLLARFAVAYTTCALAFAAAIPVSFALARQVPFNALEVVWSPHQFLWLALLYLLFFVPFLFAAGAIGLALSVFPARAGRLYAADLLGAGSGAVAIVGVLFLAPPEHALRALAGAALLATLPALGALAGAQRRRAGAGAAAVAAALVLAPGAWLAPQPSPFKGLSQALAVHGAQLLETRSSPLAQLSVVASPRVPFRHAPGLSLLAAEGPPEQLGVFSDADNLSVITRAVAGAPPPAYLDALTAAAPYRLLRAPRVLVLGAGAGQDVLLARRHGARRIDAVELNPDVIDLLRGPYAAFSGHLYHHPAVRVHLAEARAFVAASRARYDLIQMTMLDSAAAASAGVHALSESYLYTVDAFGDYLAHLAPGGLLAVTRWLKLPPRDSLKLFATAIAALQRAGVAAPGQHLALLRGWNTTTMLVAGRDFTAADRAALRAFCADYAFDLAYLPGLRAHETNRHNRLEQPVFFTATRALLEDAGAFTARYKFDLTPATDDSPYFFNFFRWRAFPELLALRDAGGAALIEWGYLILVATLAQALLAGALFILLPLTLGSRLAAGGTAVRLGGYFFALGLAFLFIEIAFIQKLVLFLGHPLYSVAVVLSGFLVFAGTGSALSERLLRRAGADPARLAAGAAGGIALLCAVCLPLLTAAMPALVGLDPALKVALALALIAPLALCMGVPFPMGLACAAAWRAGFVPWAWGINGFASVLSAALAALLAIETGFTATVAAGAVLYLLAAALLPRRGV